MIKPAGIIIQKFYMVACAEKMYFIKDETSPKDIVWEDISENGDIGAKMESPYHSSFGMNHPIRVKPDGSIVLLGSGRIFDAITLTLVNVLPHGITDATWKSGELFTLNESEGNSVFKHWTSKYSVEQEFYFEGSPLRCFNVSVGFVLAVHDGETTHFIVPDGALESVALIIDSEPSSIGSAQPIDYGTHLIPVDTVITNSVQAQVDVDGVHYHCSGWRASGCLPSFGVTNSLITTIYEDASITWLWTPVQFLLNCDVIGAGTVNVSNGWENAGEIITIEAKPVFGGRFFRWMGDVPREIATEPVIDITMDRARMIQAVFVGVERIELLPGDWPMYGNGPDHAGYIPGVISSGTATQKWVRAFINANQVAVGGGRVYITPYVYFDDMYLAAVDEVNGTNIWYHSFGSGHSINPPAYDAGNVYVQNRGEGSSVDRTKLWSINAATGVENWNSSIRAQWERYYSPTIADGGIWVNGGAYGGMYGFDQSDGAERFFYELEQYNQWTPAYADGVVYSWVEGNFRAHHPYSGAIVWDLDLGWKSSGAALDRTIAISDGFGYVTRNDRLLAINLADQELEWSFTGSYERTPAVANGVVYASVGSAVVAFDAFSGSHLITYYAPARIGYNLVVCDNALFASSSSETYIFDLWTQLPRQVIPFGGHLTVANGTLYISGASAVYAYDITPGF